MNSSSAQSTLIDNEGSELIDAALERILRPIVKIFIGRVSCNYILEKVKKIFLEEARAHVESNYPGRKVTRSKLALMSGLDTRTIKSLEDAYANDDTNTTSISPESLVFHGWTNYSEYLDRYKQPKVIPIFGATGTFQGLVSSEVGRNVTTKTLLDKLLESGNVEIVDKNYVRLVDPFYQPIKQSESTALDAGSGSINRLAETVLNNLNQSGQEKPLLQQMRWSTNIPKKKFQNVLLELDELTRTHIQEVCDLLAGYETKKKKSDSMTLGLGWYVVT